MSTFSQRYGYVPPEKAFQRERLDEELRVRLWNILNVAIWKQFDPSEYASDHHTRAIKELKGRLWVHFFNRDIDSFPDFRNPYVKADGYQQIKDYFFTCEWYRAYDLLETIAKDSTALLNATIQGWINEALTDENAAYRFVSSEIVEVTDRTEIAAIEEAIADAEPSAREHLAAALRMLSDRPNPDYRNSIKESISAIEAQCRYIVGDQSATLSDALKRMKVLHPAFSKALGHLYGYTGDASGIRHALGDPSDVAYEHAKFMLVTCSAFVSYVNASVANA